MLGMLCRFAIMPSGWLAALAAQWRWLNYLAVFPFQPESSTIRACLCWLSPAAAAAVVVTHMCESLSSIGKRWIIKQRRALRPLRKTSSNTDNWRLVWTTHQGAVLARIFMKLNRMNVFWQFVPCSERTLISTGWRFLMFPLPGLGNGLMSL